MIKLVYGIILRKSSVVVQMKKNKGDVLVPKKKTNKQMIKNYQN